MDKNTAGLALVLIIAAAGLVNDKPWAWGLAAITCALAFLAEELGAAPGSIGMAMAHVGVALLSWATVAAAFLALVI